MKKYIALLLALAMAFSLAACGTPSSSPSGDDGSEQVGEGSDPATEGETEPGEGSAPEAGGTLRVILSAEPGSINPLVVTSAGDCNYVTECIYDTLLSYNSDTNELDPGVATAWEWIDDTHLQMTLRDDVIAADGTTFTANDVMYTIQCGVSGDAASNWQYVDIDECRVVDDTTIIIGMTEVHPTYVSLLANVMYVPLVDESSVEANGGWEACARDPICTTGPYTLAEWKDGEYIRLVKNENYWGEESYYDEILFTWVEDSTARTMAVAAGDADFAVDIAGTDYNALSSYDGCVGYITPSGGTSCLFLNTTNEYLANEQVREAIYLALDANAMRAVGSAGLGELADSVLPSNNPYYHAADGDYTHETNVEAALQLMADAGYADGFELNFPVPSFDEQDAQVIQTCLSQIGITVKLDVMEFFSYLTVSDTGAYDLALQATTPADVTTALGYFDDRMDLNLRFGGIVGGFDDLNEIIDVCRYSTDEETLMQGWADFQDYIRDHHLVVPCYESSFFYAANGSYNMTYATDGVINFDTVTPAA